MSKKLEKGTFPAGHSPNDFKCFGPPALTDGDFERCKIADLGSFSQDDKDSNKFYAAMIAQSKINQKWFVYFEWGRVGATNPQFQVVECRDEMEAQDVFAAQCHEKNDKRGVWTTIAGKKTLTAKPGKDVYLVRQLATRSTGLPDAKTIKYTEDVVKQPVKSVVKTKSTVNIDQHTSKLLKDLMGGTISYTRGSMADNSIPSQNSINDARDIIQEAQKRLVVVGNDLDDQIADKDLRAFSGELYRRIPKIKRVGTPDNVWILSQNNILSWQADLDAFESALVSENQIESKEDSDPFQGLPLYMEWLDPKSELGKFMYFWWPKATANKHHNIKELKPHNIWKIDRHGDHQKLANTQEEIIKNKPKCTHKPLFQPNERIDISPVERERYSKSNTGLLFHGTRSCNTIGILRESFRFPKELTGVVITGAMFGPGSYYADDIKKSAGYTSLANSYWSNGGGAIKGRHAFMFACDVILGEPHLAPGPRGYTGPPNGTHCIFGKGRNALAYTGGKEYSGVENNEWIIFNKNQVEIKYLVEFSN